MLALIFLEGIFRLFDCKCFETIIPKKIHGKRKYHICFGNFFCLGTMFLIKINGNIKILNLLTFLKR